jgi:phosphatidylinositol glycan class B
VGAVADVRLAAPEADAGRPADWRLLRLILVLAFVLRAAVALFTDAIVQPDEIYQYVEQAHRLVFGWGFIPWEFQHGARSWLIAGAIAPILKACALVGLGRPDIYQPAVKIVLCAVSVTLPLSAYRIGQATIGEAGARVALVGTSIWYELVNMAARPFPDALGTYALIGALSVMLAPPRRSAGESFGALCGLALALRFQFIPAAAAMLAVAAILRRGWIVRAVAAFAVVAILSGALDAVTLGEWFGSVIENVRFNIVDGMAKTFGVSPPYQYLTWLAASSFGLAAAGALGLALSVRRTWPISLPLLIQFAAFSAISHKEPRFIVFMAPLWLLGLGALVPKPDGRRMAAAWMAAITIVSPLGLFRLLPFENRVYPHPLVARSDVRQAYLVLSRRGDVTGLIDASGTNWGETGGYYDLNQPAPIYRPDIPATAFRRAVRAPDLYADYWLARAGARPPGGFGQPERIGALVLWRRAAPIGAVATPPGYSTRLPDFAVTRRPPRGSRPGL